MKKKFIALCYSLLVFSSSVYSKGNFQVAPLFTDHMVLQREANVPIWGWTEASTEVKAVGSWAPSDTFRTKSDGEGRFEIVVPTGKAGGAYTLAVHSPYGNSTFTDLYLGEVWLCSGQSNMEMSPACGIYGGDSLIHAASDPMIRVYNLPRRGASSPQQICDAVWEVASPEVLLYTSALAQSFALELYRSLDVPVGIIVTAWGGTGVELWMPEAEVARVCPKYPHLGEREPRNGHPDRAGVLFNQMIYPVAPYAISGALWYQGEHNAWGPEGYADKMEAMIGAWRRLYRKEFPFYLVQIAPFTYNMGYPGAALLREQQELITQRVPNTEMVVASDLTDDVSDIHPKEKIQLGKRMARLALSDHYKQSIIGTKSPVFGSARLENGKYYVTLKELPTGLVCRGKVVEGLCVKSPEGVWLPAQGRLKKNEIVVWNKEVSNPVAVSYCFDEATCGNLFSAEGMPVTPFRSDRGF